jgi:hypothetical protein
MSSVENTLHEHEISVPFRDTGHEPSSWNSGSVEHSATLQNVSGSGVFCPQIEGFVDAGKAAQFLCISRKHLMKLSRQGLIPAYPLGIGERKTWRYLLSEIRNWVLTIDAASQASGQVARMHSGGSLKGKH